MEVSKFIKIGAAAVSIVALIFVYKNYNPTGNAYFPKCPLKQVTGLECPGCGSQRAVHHLLNFDIGASMDQNPMLVLSIPYLLLGFAFQLVKEPGDQMLRWRKRLFGTKAIYVILTLIISFWILRNVL